MNPRRYVFDGRGEPVEEQDIGKWVDWHNECAKTDARVVGRHPVGGDRNDAKVVTEFLGVDRVGDGRLWESTMFDPSTKTLLAWKCHGGRRQAMEMHLKMVERFKEMVAPRVAKKEKSYDWVKGIG